MFRAFVLLFLTSAEWYGPTTKCKCASTKCRRALSWCSGSLSWCLWLLQNDVGAQQNVNVLPQTVEGLCPAVLDHCPDVPGGCTNVLSLCTSVFSVCSRGRAPANVKKLSMLHFSCTGIRDQSFALYLMHESHFSRCIAAAIDCL